MRGKNRNLGVIVPVIAVALFVASCSTYGYSLVTHNETTAKIREHEILGSITLEVTATSEMYENETGFRAILLEKARAEYGDGVDDVVNIAISQSEAVGFSTITSYLIIQADAIRYEEG